jgi:hypothetical protein
MRPGVIAAILALMVAACSSGSSTTEAENPVDVCVDKGIGPAHADYEKCLEDTARGQCAQVGAADSQEYNDCMKQQHDAAFARDQVRRWGF